MIESIKYRAAQIDDVQLISNLVLSIFNKFISPGFSLNGRQIFQDFVQPSAILERLETGKSFTLVAALGEKIIGTIEMRDGNHISLLFVADNYHRVGIARKLVSLAIEKIKATEITVHSSPYALEIYKRMGFAQLEEEQEKDGIRYIPMKLKFIM